MGLHQVDIGTGGGYNHLQRINLLLRFAFHNAVGSKPSSSRHRDDDFHIYRLAQHRFHLVETCHCLLQLGNALIAVVDRQEATAHYALVAPPKIKPLQNYTNAVDVVAHISLTYGGLLGRHISASSGRLLEYGVAVAIGKTEVDNLQRTAIGGNHDVRWLQVAVSNTARVNVFHGIEQLPGNLQTLGSRCVALSPHIEGDALHIFHHNAGAQSGNFFNRHRLHHTLVAHRHKRVKLLAQHLRVSHAVGSLGVKSL